MSLPDRGLTALALPVITLVVFLAVLGACVFLFFFARHHRRTGNVFRACTVWEIYRGIRGDVPDIPPSRLMLFFFLTCAGIATAFFPAALVLLARWCPAGGGWFVVGGVVAAIGAVANAFAMLVSHMSFGFGASNSSRDQTPFFWIIPGFQLAFAGASIALGTSTLFAGWIGDWLAR